MCFGGRSSAAADEARATREAAERDARDREKRIRQGAWEIERAFGNYLGVDPTVAGVPNLVDASKALVESANAPDFFGDYEKSIIDYQKPQVEDQYNRSFGDMVSALARRGMLESTVGASETGRLDAAFADENVRIANDAKNSARDLRSQIERQKSDLLALNTASADPVQSGAAARAAATSISMPSPTSRVGQVFSGIMEPYIAYTTAARNAAPERPRSTAPVASGAGSSRIVR